MNECGRQMNKNRQTNPMITCSERRRKKEVFIWPHHHFLRVMNINCYWLIEMRSPQISLHFVAYVFNACVCHIPVFLFLGGSRPGCHSHLTNSNSGMMMMMMMKATTPGTAGVSNPNPNPAGPSSSPLWSSQSRRGGHRGTWRTFCWWGACRPGHHWGSWWFLKVRVMMSGSTTSEVPGARLTRQTGGVWFYSSSA